MVVVIHHKAKEMYQMDENLQLTNLERDIMDIIWEKKDLSGAEIKYEMKDSHGISRETVKAYVRRLIEKELVGVNKISQRVHRYYPLITKEEFIAGDFDVFLKQHKKGLTHLVASMVRNNKVSDAEINELEKIIKEYKNKE